MVPRVSGIQGHRLPVPLAGLLCLSLLLEGLAQQMLGLGVRGIGGECAFQCLPGLVRLTGPEQNASLAPEMSRLLRLHADRLLVLAQRLLQPTLCLQDLSDPGVDGGRSTIPRPESPAQGFQGLCRIAHLLEQGSRGQRKLAVVRRQLYGTLIRLQGLAVLLSALGDRAPESQSEGVGGVERQCPLQRGASFVEPSHLQADRCQPPLMSRILRSETNGAPVAP